MTINLKDVPQKICKWFNVSHTLECGQVFRFFKLGDSRHVCISLDKWCVVEQLIDSVALLSFDLEYFERYFDLATDYDSIEKYLSQYPELTTPVKYCRGLHILRQNLHETIVSFIVSANNNIGRIKNTLNAVCKAYGKEIEIAIDDDTQVLYTLPTIEDLANIDVLQWASFGAGYRSAQLHETCNTLKNSDILTRLVDASYSESYDLLISLKGIGPKVADCVALFGLSHRSGFPVDTWVFKGLKTEELNTKAKVHQYYTNRYGEYGGYAQQYIFYFNRSIKKIAI